MKAHELGEVENEMTHSTEEPSSSPLRPEVLASYKHWMGILLDLVTIHRDRADCRPTCERCGELGEVDGERGACAVRRWWCRTCIDLGTSLDRQTGP